MYFLCLAGGKLNLDDEKVMHLLVFFFLLYYRRSDKFEAGDDSVIKSTGCFFRGPRFCTQYPHGDLQPSITPVPMPSSELCV